MTEQRRKALRSIATLFGVAIAMTIVIAALARIGVFIYDLLP